MTGVQGGDDTTQFGKVIAGTVMSVLTVLVYATTHEEWRVWLIGTNHRWATGVIVLLGSAVFVVAGSMKAIADSTLAILTSLAAVLAVAALASGSLTPLSLLVVVIVVVWLVAVSRDLMELTHHRPHPA